MEPPPPIITQPDYCILIDFEATCDTSDENLTRLQQCDTHEIIEFVSRLQHTPNTHPATLHGAQPRACRGSAAIYSARPPRGRCSLIFALLSAHPPLPGKFALNPSIHFCVCAQPAVWLAARDLEDGTTAGAEIGHFREYVRPVESRDGSPTRALSEFCTTLTGIAQATLDSSSALSEVLEHFEAWLSERGLVTALETGRAVLVAHGGWDLGDQLPRECARKGIVLPPFFDSHADLKVIFALTCPENRGTSLKQMLDYFAIPAQGRQHSGLDDCRNFGRILAQLLNLGADLSPTYRLNVGQLRGHGVGKRPGDWDCPCGAVAFGSKAACYRCGEPRPEGLAPPVCVIYTRTRVPPVPPPLYN